MPGKDDRDPPPPSVKDLAKRLEQGGDTRRYSTGSQQAAEITKTIAERIAELEAARVADSAKVSTQAVEIKAELEWIKSLGIVSKRLAELRGKYEQAPNPIKNDPQQVYEKLCSLVERLVPTQQAWKDATYVWYGKRGEALLRIDSSIATVRSVLAKPTVYPPAARTQELLTACMALNGAVNTWAAKKLNTTRTEFEDKALELDDRRLKSPLAKEYYSNLRYLAAVNQSFVALLDEAARTKTVKDARKAEMLELFETLEFDGPTFQLCNAATLYSSGKAVVKQTDAVKQLLKEGAKEVSTQIALEFKTQALKEAANALDVLGIVDGLTAMWNAYKVYERSKAKQNAENQACTRLDDPMVLHMIDTLQSQIQFQCEKAAEAAVVYAAAAATKAATQGVGAPVAEALKAMKKLNDVIEQIGITAHERAELLAITSIDRSRDRDAFTDRVVQNVTLTCYYIRLAAPENLLRPMSYTLYQLDGGKSFKTVHDTPEMQEALADVLGLKECADEILMAWNTEIKNLQERAARTTPLDDILASYPEIDPGKKKKLTNYLSGKTRNLKEDMRQAKEGIIKTLKAQPAFKRVEQVTTRVDQELARAHRR